MKDAFAKILIGTLKLHELTMQGKDESEEYEEVCDEMDKFWYSMSVEEQNRAREFSSLLYVVSDHLLGNGKKDA